jgi:hypothetical protein
MRTATAQMLAVYSVYIAEQCSAADTYISDGLFSRSLVADVHVHLCASESQLSL